MGREEIVSRVISDAEREAEKIVADAKKRAEQIVADAQNTTDAEVAEAEREAEERAKRITDGRAATARLDCAKILLAEKRRVIDGVYLRALAALLSLDKRESVLLAQKLLKEHAETGDEVVFAENYPYAAEVAALPVFGEKKLSAAKERMKLSGGFMLRGKASDKDLSYGALLAADREEHEAEIALALFTN